MIPTTPEEYEEYEKEHGYRFCYGDYDVFLDYDQNRWNIPRPDIHTRIDESKAVEMPYTGQVTDMADSTYKKHLDSLIEQKKDEISDQEDLVEEYEDDPHGEKCENAETDAI